MLSRSLLTLFLTGFAAAQQISVGVTAGTNVTQPFHDFQMSTTFPGGESGRYLYTSGPRQFIVGPAVELLLPRNFSVEVDALHRELPSKLALEQPSGFPVIHFPGSRVHTTWEFPILAKYTIARGSWRPFGAAGISLRPAGNGSGLSHWGTTVGLGVERNWRQLRISPTLRYTRWSQPDHYFAIPPQRQDHLEFLVGFHYGPTAGSATAFGRRLSVGILAGLAFGDDLKVPFPKVGGVGEIRSEANSPVSGLSLEFQLWRRFSVEADGLYRPLHSTFVPDVSIPEFRQLRSATLTWEFPVQLKYRLPELSRATPFIEAGPSFRAVANLSTPEPSHIGFTAGVGIEWKLWRLKLGPVVRYTRWQATSADAFDPRARTNQAQLLFGASF